LGRILKSPKIIAVGASAMLLAVALGAFGSHALKTRLGPDLLAVWHTAVTYQMAHALGLLIIGLLLQHLNTAALVNAQNPAQASQTRQTRLLQRAAMLMLAGIVIFCGSLYLLALTGQRWLGAITPLGGVAFLLAWATLAWSHWRPD
jgi:uncharacterized membrane protein YgdD (TMEM256/DUF423 family)